MEDTLRTFPVDMDLKSNNNFSLFYNDSFILLIYSFITRSFFCTPIVHHQDIRPNRHNFIKICNFTEYPYLLKNHFEG